MIQAIQVCFVDDDVCVSCVFKIWHKWICTGIGLITTRNINNCRPKIRTLDFDRDNCPLNLSLLTICRKSTTDEIKVKNKIQIN